MVVQRHEEGGPARLAEALSSGVPLKIVVQVEDLIEESVPGRSHFAFGLRSAQLASAAMSLDDVFVLAGNGGAAKEQVERRKTFLSVLDLPPAEARS